MARRVKRAGKEDLFTGSIGFWRGGAGARRSVPGNSKDEREHLLFATNIAPSWLVAFSDRCFLSSSLRY